MLTPNDVFTPGRIPVGPTNVYASRGTVEKDYEKAHKRGLVPIVFGEYGVGKTSLARYAARQEDRAGLLVNIESVADKAMSDVFARCLEKLGHRVSARRTRTETTTTNLEEGMGAEIGFEQFKATLSSKRSTAGEIGDSVEEELVVTAPTDSRVIELCEQAGIVLILDELHRASAEFAEQLSKFLKAYGNASCHRFRIGLLGTSSDAARLVRRDQGIDRLIQEVHLKAMSDAEAYYIVEKGMSELCIQIGADQVRQIVRLSVGSPSIVQYICLEVAEAAFERAERAVHDGDVDNAVSSFVEKRAARLDAMYKKGIETVGPRRYRKQILRAMSEIEDEYVTMEDLRGCVSRYLSEDVPSTTLSGPLRQLKTPEFGSILRDVERPVGDGRVYNYTSFSDPALKAFIRMQNLWEE